MRDTGCGMRKRRVHVRRDAGEAPLLLFRGGEAELREASDRAFADLLEPRRRGGGAVPRERFEIGDVAVRDAHATAASVRSQSYPFSSSSSARSFPPGSGGGVSVTDRYVADFK